MELNTGIAHVTSKYLQTYQMQWNRVGNEPTNEFRKHIGGLSGILYRTLYYASRGPMYPTPLIPSLFTL